MSTEPPEIQQPEEVRLDHLGKGNYGLSDLTGNVYKLIDQRSGYCVAEINGAVQRVPGSILVIPKTEAEISSITAGAAGAKTNVRKHNGERRMAKNRSSSPKTTGNPYADPESFSKENLARFDEQVDKRGPNECWPWKGRKTGPSGAFFVGGKEMRVGKYVYLREHPDADPAGRYVQECTPDCCNGKHVHPVVKGGKKAAAAESGKRDGKAKTSAKAGTAKKDKAPASEPPATAPLKKGPAKQGGVDMSNLTHPKPGSAKKAGGKKPAAAATARVEQPPQLAEKRVRKPAPKKSSARNSR